MNPIESKYKFRSKLWRWQGGKASWHFFTLPQKVADEIRLVDAGPRRTGFGALRVEATIGRTAWQTSIFPSSAHDSYLLPVKAAVRRAEKLAEDGTATIRLVVRRSW